jgi:proteic killer suppression protein
MRWESLLEVRIASRALEKKLKTERARVKSYGAEMARTLERRLAQLQAAPDLEAMRTLPGRCHALSEDRAGQLAVSLSRNVRLVFEPDHDPTPELETGGLDWTRVTRVRILEVEDYHGK